MKYITIALAGNPNSGKTTIFNRLTGARQHVGNYPGVTVEIKEGSLNYKGYAIKVVDLPGIYSLTAYSADEIVARDFIIHEKPNLVVNIIDSSNLERNLYLTVQLMEIGIPLILVFNMIDEARARGYKYDKEKFTLFLNVPVVETIGHKGQGINELLDKIIFTVDSINFSFSGDHIFNYGEEIENEISKIKSLLDKNTSLSDGYNTRWLAIKLLENDKDLMERINSHEINRLIEERSFLIENITGEAPETLIAEKRYGLISGICQKAVLSTVEARHTVSDSIDSILTNRILGIPIFFGLMYLVFSFVFTLGDIPMGLIEESFKWLGDKGKVLWPENNLIASLIIDGIINGVGNVLVFLPNILFLFLAIAILEDSGYMARAAFIMDRLMNKIGLHGKSFIPMLIGFGCSVPAIMATRTLENRRDRLVTMLVVPLMSCGARLPIYTLIIPAFFPENLYAPILWVIYLIGVTMAILMAKILRSTTFKGEAIPFIMELPPYRMPTIRGILTHMWLRGWLYVKKAGTIILGISILMWLMSTFPGLPAHQEKKFDEERQKIESTYTEEKERSEKIALMENMRKETQLRYSIAGRIGNIIEPIIRPMGFDWKIGTALMGAFAAKEVFVAQLGIVYSIGEVKESSETLREKLKENYSPLTGFCIMLFCLIGMPCMATVAIVARESSSWRWALAQLIGLTLIAYLITTIVYQTGYFLGVGMK
ncbi:MAG TPA: ferrous iron transport protein B [Syntrophorhabdaceae bacterium]|nr:ferrous iron transport protein B [Syntrophorhabdaceae bacterium]